MIKIEIDSRYFGGRAKTPGTSVKDKKVNAIIDLLGITPVQVGFSLRKNDLLQPVPTISFETDKGRIICDYKTEDLVKTYSQLTRMKRQARLESMMAGMKTGQVESRTKEKGDGGDGGRA